MDAETKSNRKSKNEPLQLNIDGDRLRDQLIEIGKNADLKDFGKRKAVLELLKGEMAEGRKQAQEALETGVSGIETATALCHLQDVIIQVLYDYTTSFPYRASTEVKGEKIGIVAVGGYGRGLMAPGSDVDILFLLPYKQTPWGESVVEYILLILYDLGLKVGHATRTVDDCIQKSLADMTIRTTILEARYLWGDKTLFEELRKRFDKEVVAGTATTDFIDAKLNERDVRHRRAGESRYLVEPNIKDGKGGLRDLHTLFWIGKYAYRVDKASELIAKGLYTEAEFKRFQKAEVFFWDVRCHLHFMTGRAEERLSFDHQVSMAERLGFKQRGGQAAVERFMTRYFKAAKEVGDLTRIFCAALELQEKKTAPRIGDIISGRGFRSRRATSDPSFVVERGRVAVTDPKVFKKAPINLLKLFKVVDEEQVYIHPATLTAVTRSLSLIDDDLRENEEANQIFMDILTSRNNSEPILRRMNESGVLGRFIPDFGKVEAMMQFNMYHHYTVDEHTINAMGILSKIERGELAEDHPLANEIIHHVVSRNVLYVALFLHDIAKGREGDHSVVGAQVTRDLCPRLGFDAAETETVAWLVENHLAFSEYAQTRDIADPKTVDNFCNIIQSPERLRLLLILTVADIRGVGPGVWNGWKGELLRRLYDEAEQVLSGSLVGESLERQVTRSRNKLKEALQHWQAEDIDAFIARHDDQYWIGLDTATHKRHAELMVEIDKEGLPENCAAMSAVPDDFRDVTQVSIYTKDEFGLFAKLTGAIAASGASIADARVFTTHDGMALDVFWVHDSQGTSFDEKRRLDKLQATIGETLAGRFNPANSMPRRLSQRRERAFSVEPQVLIDNGASNIATVIETNGRDRPGLLYDLANALSSLRLSVSSAHVATFGERAVGVYYVKDHFGFKVTHEVSLRDIRKTLIAAIRGEGVGEAAAE